MRNKSLKRLVIAVILLLISFLVGLIGFMQIERFNLVDAFYMTVITFSTVGFNEVRPLSADGRLFTSIYIIFNLGVFGYVVSIITSYFFEGELQHIFKQFIWGKEVKKVKNHTIVVGYGRNGSKACDELENSNQSFVIIEFDKERIDEMPERHSKKTVEGDATHDEILNLAGVEKAKAIITTLPSDAENVFITLTARGLNKAIFIISRASEEQSMIKLQRAGANKVVMPDALGGIHMAHLITKPYVNEFLELFTGMGNTELRLEEFSYDQFKNDCQDKTISQFDVRNKTGVTVVGFKDQHESFKFSPGPDTLIGSDDIVIVLGKKDEVDGFKSNYIK